MTKGIANVDYIRQGSEVTLADAPNWSFIYSVSAVKDPAYALGDRIVLPDGREFRYAYSAAACISGQACESTATGYTAITTFTVTAAVGATSITVPAATHAALTVDELRGGYIIIFDGSTNNVQFRGIVGNAAAAANAAFVCYLDGPLDTAITTSSKCETYKSPFSALQTGTSVNYPKMGVPAVQVSAASKYFWVQTKGLCWVAPQTGLGASKEQGACWRHDGSIDTVTNGVSGSAYVASQYAGFIVEGSAAGNGPLFNLVS